MTGNPSFNLPDYCANPCSQFAWGSDTIKECNGCGSDKKCAPDQPYYGDDWKHIGHGEEL
jgi:hypothetical protein